MRKTIITAALALAACGGSDGFAVGVERDAGDEATATDTATPTTETLEDAAAEAEPASEAAADTADTTPLTDTTPPDSAAETTPPDTSPPDTPVEACVDGDGDGDPALACGGLDCHDGNKLVSSKQTGWFDKNYTTVSGTSSWDYNCSGKTEYEYPERMDCRIDATGTGCIFKKGYSATFTPTCGSTFQLVVKCTYTGTSCAVYPSDTTTATQRCH